MILRAGVTKLITITLSNTSHNSSVTLSYFILFSYFYFINLVILFLPLFFLVMATYGNQALRKENRFYGFKFVSAISVIFLAQDGTPFQNRFSES